MAGVRIVHPCIVVFLLFAALLVTGQCNCTHGNIGTSYTTAASDKAVDEAKRLDKLLQTVGTGRNPYPHYFGNGEGLTFLQGCARPNLREFPILSDGTLFSNKSVSQGPDRVVYHQTTGMFCGCMTHNGASTASGFVLCR